jgi:hypothetical protein
VGDDVGQSMRGLKSAVGWRMGKCCSRLRAIAEILYTLDYVGYAEIRKKAHERLS